jgi:hypothetical protein
MKEVSHHVDLQWNILWLRQTASGGRFKYRLNGSKRNERRWRNEGTMMVTLAKGVHTVSQDTAHMEE